MVDSSLPRQVARELETRLARSPVVVVSGARQTGKTTLVRAVAAERSYETLDSLATLDRARQEPEALVAGAKALTIDEVQRAPDLLLAIKREIDQERKPGRFLLTGSANLLLMKTVGESLAGRAVYLVLRPLCEREKHGSAAPPVWSTLLAARSVADAVVRMKAAVPVDRVRPRGWSWPSAAIEGGLPPAALAANAADRALWFDGYVDTYLQRDLRDLAQVGDLGAFLRFVKVAALRTGALLNQADLARDAGLSHATAQRWLSLLETSFQVTLVPAFASSRTKRLIKAPKLYFGDTGLALHLAGIAELAALKAEPNVGAHLEALVLNDLLVWRELVSPKPAIFHYRSAGGEEIDLIVEQGRRLLPVEIKSRRAVRVADARALDSFCAERGLPVGILLYDGDEILPLTRHTLALPLTVALFGTPA